MSPRSLEGRLFDALLREVGPDVHQDDALLLTVARRIADFAAGIAALLRKHERKSQSANQEVPAVVGAPPSASHGDVPEMECEGAENQPIRRPPFVITGGEIDRTTLRSFEREIVDAPHIEWSLADRGKPGHGEALVRRIRLGAVGGVVVLGFMGTPLRNKLVLACKATATPYWLCKSPGRGQLRRALAAIGHPTFAPREQLGPPRL